ncbi:MAG: CO dehydrogenase/acetyl-CoA synthase subunit delta [Firmicutes bacterium]|nr:CO dehydrogenase/acetyl-CoA synthase subunit delta [Bacillota bacterium]MCL5039469.1 CO dehydrogenase/acetyl-CoA synthase subunit delta [Bacillota bacterium]
MAIEVLKERYSSRIREVVLGATPEQGGTRTHTITIGGDSTLPFLHFEGEVPHRPVVAVEVLDRVPEWSPTLTKYYEDVLDDPAAWAKKAVEQYAADLIYLKLQSADPELGDSSPEQCARTVKDVLGAVGVPLIVVGSGNEEKDNQVLPAVAEAAAGENLLLGIATQDNYKTLTAACMVHKHNIIAQSPIDINICKQLNILISEMNLPLDRIVIDTSIGALGYGIEYSYSIMERTRLGGLTGDKMLGMPVFCNVGYEVGRTKEFNAGVAEFPGWGPQEERGIVWEAMTATALLQAGGHIVVMRHPEAIKLVKKNIDAMMQKNGF